MTVITFDESGNYKITYERIHVHAHFTKHGAVRGYYKYKILSIEEEYEHAHRFAVWIRKHHFSSREEVEKNTAHMNAGIQKVLDSMFPES
jgi:hypothetical protein